MLPTRKETRGDVSTETLFVNVVLKFIFYTESGSRYARGISARKLTMGHHHSHLLHKCLELTAGFNTHSEYDYLFHEYPARNWTYEIYTIMSYRAGRWPLVSHLRFYIKL